MKYAAFSLILPELTLEEQVALCRDLGYDALELRVRDMTPQDRDQPYSFWGRHRDPIGPSNLTAEIPRLLRTTAGAGVALCALAPYTGITDPDAFAPMAAAAEALGAPLIRVTAPAWDGTELFEPLFDRAIAGLESIETIARRHGVKAVIEIHMGTIAPSASAVRRLLEGFDPEAVGAILDPGNMIHEGYESWSLAAAILGPYLAHVHVKNARWVLTDKPAGGPWRWAPKPATLREGAADWREILRVLHQAGYEGTLTVEDATDQPTRAKLEDALAFLQTLEPDPA